MTIKYKQKHLINFKTITLASPKVIGDVIKGKNVREKGLSDVFDVSKNCLETTEAEEVPPDKILPSFFRPKTNDLL